MPLRFTTETRSKGPARSTRCTRASSGSFPPGSTEEGKSQRDAEGADDAAMALPSRSSSSWPRSRSRQSATAVTPVVATTTRPAMSVKSLRRRVTIGAQERSTRMPPPCSGGPFLRAPDHGALLLLAAVAGAWRLEALRGRGPPPLRAVPPGQPGVLALGRTAATRRGLPALPPLLPEQGVAMLRAFVAGKIAQRARRPTPPVEVGSCAACHLSHDATLAADRRLARPPHPLRAEAHRLREVPRRRRPRLRAGLGRLLPATASTWSGVAGMTRLHCFACHEFLTADPGLRPTRRDCLRCHPSARGPRRPACADPAADGDRLRLLPQAARHHAPGGGSRPARGATWWRRRRDSTTVT